VITSAGCAREIGGDLVPGGDASSPGSDGGSSQMDAGRFGNPDPNVLHNIPDAAFAQPTVDAFFIDDPPPRQCGPNGEEQPAPTPGGTPQCPDDKNREGCPCPELGMSAACWPGKRVNRNHGICRDGTTRCNDTTEFGLRWGPCEGYVLPRDGALAGPEACGCFSSGRWTLDNLSPCIYRGMQTYLYSSTLTGSGTIDCGANVPEPPPVPAAAWSSSTLNVDCAGDFRLCYAIKAGDAANPRPDDCMIMQTCVDVSYPNAGVDQALPDLPAWSSSNTQCAAEFDRIGGYGEMTVLGQSVECDAIDDGMGNPYVFHRTDYCPPSCQQTPDTPECRDCQTGGSGMFGENP
jgi:hypothetical protein